MKTDFCLEDWTVKPQRNRIRRGDETVHLAPKAMAVLQCLADAGGEVVSRDELFDAVWPGALISDDALTQQIVELRKAFDDCAHDPKFIETIPKQGFRLIPPVLAPSQKLNPRRAYAVAASVTLLMLVVVVVDFYWIQPVIEDEPEAANATMTLPNSQETEAAPELHTIAVLPFVYLSDDEEGSYLGESFADTVLHMLAQVPELHVISRSSSFEPQIQGLGISEIAEKLGVATILEGSVQRQGDQLRITAQLIDAASDDHLWSGNFDRSDKDIFAIEDEVALAVVSAMKIEFSDDLKQRIEHKGTDNVEAYNGYLKGEGLAVAGKPREAMAHFERTIELDPGYAHAHVALGYLYLNAETLPELSMDEKQHKAQLAARRAIELAPDMSEALVLLAQLSEDHVVKGQLLRRAYENQPNNVPAILAYANHLGWNGDHALSEELARRALRLDPMTQSTYWSLWIVNVATGQWDEALEFIELWKERFPGSTWALSIEALHHAFQGEFYTVMSKTIEAVKLAPGNGEYRWRVGMEYLNVDMPEQAQQWFGSIKAAPRIQSWIDLSSRSYIDVYYQRNDEDVFANAKQMLLEGAGYPYGSRALILEYGDRLGRLDEVLDILEELNPRIFSKPPPGILKPSEADIYYSYALALLLSGDTEKGEPLMRACLDAEDVYYAAYKLVRLRAIEGRLALGERDAAMEQFRRFAELKWIWNGGQMTTRRKFQYSGLYDPIRNEPEFIALLDLYEKNAADQRRLVEEADFQIP